MSQESGVRTEPVLWRVVLRHNWDFKIFLKE